MATETSLERERTMIAAINRGVGGFDPLGAGQFLRGPGQFSS